MADIKPLVLDTSGQIMESAMSLDQLSDVAISLPVTGHALTYNGSAWSNAAVSSGGTRFIDGGNASSVYTLEQVVDGGGSGSF